MNRYKDIGKFINKNKKTYYTNAVYPTIPESLNDIYVIATDEDRYDKLALQFYQDSSLWWIIASANNQEKASMFPTPGTQLRIPTDIAEFLNSYKRINSSR